jgi:hypothetical protein
MFKEPVLAIWWEFSSPIFVFLRPASPGASPRLCINIAINFLTQSGKFLISRKYSGMMKPSIITNI